MGDASEERSRYENTAEIHLSRKFLGRDGMASLERYAQVTILG